jgi:hypothetical protein
MRDDIRKILTEQPVKPTAKEVLWPLIETMPFGERAEPLQKELLWVLMGKQNPETHEFILPAYCYNIFEKLTHTVFKGFPSLSETVSCTDPAKLAHVKTYEEAKQFLKLDWYRFGKLIGILIRSFRFLDLEIENQVKQDGMWELEPGKEKDVVAMLGSQWLEKKGVPVGDLPAGELSAAIVKTFSASVSAKVPDGDLEQIWKLVAYHFGLEAMSEFRLGVGDGMKEFLDENADLVGETTTSNNYFIFLLLWPEIKGMLERNPLPNRPEVFEWITPLHQTGFVAIPNIDYFYNFCESIGLKFAGRPPKKT